MLDYIRMQFLIMAITFRSSVFEEGGKIPRRYTCDGEDVSPPLEWEGIPEGTQSLALICDDPDAPGKTWWVHWVLYNTPAEAKKLLEGIPNNEVLEDGSLHGINDFNKYGYAGPCPPSGIHRYFFNLYALDRKLDLPAGATKAKLLMSMEGHILELVQLIGKYGR